MRTRIHRAFAAPFVIVVASCGGKSTAPKQPDTATPTEVSDLPDPPAGEGKRTAGPDGTTVIAYPSGDRVIVGVDGKCRAEYKENCGGAEGDGDVKPVVMDCNPPPPQQVKCPK